MAPLPSPLVPCSPWTTDAEVRECCSGLLPQTDLTRAIMFASKVLFRLSGRQFPGVCTKTLWPCWSSTCGSGDGPTWNTLAGSDWMGGGYPSTPYRTGDGWGNDWNGACGGRCHLPCLEVPGRIHDVLEIVVDQEVISPDAWRIEGRRRICRVDGRTWPCANNLLPPDPYVDPVFALTVNATGGGYGLRLTMPGRTVDVPLLAVYSAAAAEAAINTALGVPAASVVTGGPGGAGGTSPYLVTLDSRRLRSAPRPSIIFPESLTGGASTAVTDLIDPGSAPGPGAWYATVQLGDPIPDDARFVASLFACQVALARCGSEDCVLPARLKRISREDTEMDFADPLTFLSEGKVGIYEVDLWLGTVNPNRLARRSSVYRADAPDAAKRFG